jgi:hypothetical protein
VRAGRGWEAVVVSPVAITQLASELRFDSVDEFLAAGAPVWARRGWLPTTDVGWLEDARFAYVTRLCEFEAAQRCGEVEAAMVALVEAVSGFLGVLDEHVAELRSMVDAAVGDRANAVRPLERLAVRDPGMGPGLVVSGERETLERELLVARWAAGGEASFGGAVRRSS